LHSKECYGEAAEKCREAISIDAEYPEAYNLLGIVLASQEHFDDAIVEYRKADALWESAKSTDRKLALRYWAKALHSKECYKEAAEKCREAISIDAEYPEAHNLLGLVLWNLELFDEAIDEYRQAHSLWQKATSNDQKLALLGWAKALESTHSFEQAAEKYREAIEVDPNDPNSYSHLGFLYSEQGRVEDAIEQYGKTESLWKKSDSSFRKLLLVRWAMDLEWKEFYDEAIEKYQEAIGVDPEYPDAYYFLGQVFVKQERFDDAIEQYRSADALLEKAKSEDRKFLLWEWGFALLQQERLYDAVGKYALATEVAREDGTAKFLYGNTLAECWRYAEAIVQFEQAARLAPQVPYNHHNKAHFLFQLGRYEESWKEWWITRDRYASALRLVLLSTEKSNYAVDFADVLREIFYEYEESEKYYMQAIERGHDDANAWKGLAILYQQWADSDAAPPEIQARLGYTIHRARELLSGALGDNGRFRPLLSLADLHIETRDWPEARASLTLAAELCGDSRLKSAEISTRRGLVCYSSEEYAEAITHFRKALQVNPGDLTLRVNLGMALFRSKQFSAADDEFTRVLKSAPGHIDALLGAAEVCIELADDGDADRYDAAEQHLTSALQHGRNKESGSRRLRKAEIADIYYLRGYARTKRFEAESTRTASMTLLFALSDFRRCKQADQSHSKASAAIEKIAKRLRSQISGSFLDLFGPLVIFVASTFVFLVAQHDFLFREAAVRPDAKVYIALTFGALVFMVAGLYLPKVLKLKVPGIELEKTSIDRVAAPSTLDIKRTETQRPNSRARGIGPVFRVGKTELPRFTLSQRTFEAVPGNNDEEPLR
jgi:tetratricopeptide (TPR) repeat protein